MAALKLLKKYFGYESFRDSQQEIVNEIIDDNDVLAIMPTGAGKSICYQIPSLAKPGITIVVSPLISLMKDQVQGLIEAGVKAAYINSSLTPGQVAKAMQFASEGRYKIIYVAPERLLTPYFLSFAQQVDIAMVTVDEAHCISQWGQDFRPSYKDIPEFVNTLKVRPVVSAFTATATKTVREDIKELLKLKTPKEFITGFDRSNLYFEVRKPKDKTAAVLRFIEDNPGQNGIIYCTTRKAVEELCDRLKSNGYAATRYHAGLTDEERHTNQNDFLYDRAGYMVATNAFGMGIDKSNVNFVIHYNMPKDLESYYQEAGRAGRDGSDAKCLLLYSKQDYRTNEWMINNDKDKTYSDDSMELQVKEAALERLKQMTFYSTTPDCLRGFILRYFGERPQNYCDNCGSCLKIIEQPLTDDTGVTIRATKKPPAAESLPQDRVELFNRLKAVRAELAITQSVPAFVIFTDRSLIDMCVKLPKNKQQFLAINGVGEEKLKRYATAFLNEINSL